MVSCPADGGAGVGAASSPPSARSSTAPRCRCSPAAGASSATATSPAWARRCTRRAKPCRPIRAHNEQGMALAAVAFAKAKNRRQMMACTTSIGPGCTNMLTAAGVAHVNRLPVLFLPGDVFASRRPDPVLQQIEDFNDATMGVTDCFRPVSRWWDRITRPEQLLTSLPRAMQVLTDPVDCGPVTLAHVPGCAGRGLRLSGELLRARSPHHASAARAPIADEFARAVDLLRKAERPLIVAGGGVLYSARPRPRFTASPPSTASRWPKARPARAPSPGTIRRRWARSASPAARPPTRWRARPT